MAGETVYTRGFAGKVITPSMLNDTDFCVTRTWRTYGPLAVERETNELMAAGLAAHDAMQWLNEQRMHGRETPAGYVRSVARRYAAVHEVDADRAEQAVIALARATKGIRPVAVEESILVPLDWQDWRIGGTLDCRTEKAIVDFKTTATLKNWDEKKALRNAQTTGYTFLASKATGVPYHWIRYFVVAMDTFETRTIEVQASAYDWDDFKVQALSLAATLSNPDPPAVQNEKRCQQWCQLWSSGGCGAKLAVTR